MVYNWTAIYTDAACYAAVLSMDVIRVNMNPVEIPPETIKEYVAQLTSRQCGIIAQVLNGQTDKETAKILSISPRTVRKHLQNAKERIGVNSRIQLTAIFAICKYMNLDSQPFFYQKNFFGAYNSESMVDDI